MVEFSEDGVVSFNRSYKVVVITKIAYTVRITYNFRNKDAKVLLSTSISS